MTTLEIKDLHVSVDNVNAAEGDREIPILHGVDLTVKSGETHALMGPNGSGKSTLSYAIAGHPKYQVTSGSITLDGANVLEMSVDERARAGIFLAMQYPVEVPGVSVSNFLRSAATAIRGEAPKLRHWVKEVKAAMTSLEIDSAFAERNVAYLRHALTSGEHPTLARLLSQGPPPGEAAQSANPADRFRDILIRVLTALLGPADQQQPKG